MPIQFSLRYLNDNFDGIVRRMRQRGEPGFGLTHRGKDVGYLTLAVDRASQAPATTQPSLAISQLPLPVVPDEDTTDYDALQAQVENDGDLQTQIEAMFVDSPSVVHLPATLPGSSPSRASGDNPSDPV